MIWQTLAFIFSVLLLLSTILFGVFEKLFHHLRTPHRDIVKAVDKLYDSHGAQAFEQASIKELQAWYEGDIKKLGFWGRVRKEIMEREKYQGVQFRRMK